MRLIIMILGALICAVSLTACGNSTTSPGTEPLDAAAGYWSVPSSSPFGGFLLHVAKRDATYYVSIDGGPLRPATLDEGRIVLRLMGSGSRRLEFGMDERRPALFVYVSHGKNADPGEPSGFFWAPFPVKRLTAAAYERKASAKADEAMYFGLLILDFALREWAKQHDGQPPAAGDVRPDSAFGRWLENESAEVEVPWPTNPYAGAPMQAGTDPGEFRYTCGGTGYTLVGYGHDGSVMSLKDEPPN